MRLKTFTGQCTLLAGRISPDGLRVDAWHPCFYLDYSREEMTGSPICMVATRIWRPLIFLENLIPSLTISIQVLSYGWRIHILASSKPVRHGPAVWAFRWNGIWAGCMMYCLTWKRNLYIAKYHHDKLTFGMLYALRKISPCLFHMMKLSMEKQSLVNKMPGMNGNASLICDCYIHFVYVSRPKNCCLWDVNSVKALNGVLTRIRLVRPGLPASQGRATLVKDLNHIYKTHPALFSHDFDHHGFEWIDCHDVEQSIISYRRKNLFEELIVVFKLYSRSKRALQARRARGGYLYGNF